MQRTTEAAESDRQRICQVLAGAPFPAARWQLMAHAEHYGADSATRSDLWRLPAIVYEDLPTVLIALGLLPERPGYRSSTPTPASSRWDPAVSGDGSSGRQSAR